MKRLLTIIMVFCGAMAYAQTPVYKTTTGALNGSNAILRAGTDSYNIKDSLDGKVPFKVIDNFNTFFLTPSINAVYNGGLNIPNSPTESAAGVSFNAIYDTNYAFQIASVTAAPNRLFYRDKTDGIFNGWNEIASKNRSNVFTDTLTANKIILSTNKSNYIPTAKARFYSAESITEHAHYSFLADDDINFSGVGAQARAAFDDNSTFTGIADSDHIHSFQSYPHYLSTGTVARLSGFWTLPDIINGTVNELSLFKGNNPSGAGTISNLYGVYIPTLNRGINNWSIYTGAAPSFFGGTVTSPTFVGALTGIASGNLPLTGGNLTGALNIFGASTNSIFSVANDITGRMRAISNEVQISSTYGSTGSFVPLVFYTSDLARLQILANGEASFSKTVSAATPTTATHLTTKAYVDARNINQVAGTATTRTNATSTTANVTYRTIAGFSVNVSGKIEVVATASGLTQINLTVPLASPFSDTLVGNGTASKADLSNIVPVVITKIGSDTVITFNAPSAGTYYVGYSMSFYNN